MMPQSLFQQAVARQQAGDLIGAALGYEVALHREPHDHRAAANLAGVYRALGRKAASRAMCRRTAILNPGGFVGWRQLANLVEGEKTRTALERALRVSPFDVATAVTLAGVYRDQGLRSECTALSRRNLALAPAEARCWRAAGEDWLSRGNPERAAFALGRALQLDPQDQQAATALRSVLYRNEQAEEALPVAENIPQL